MKVMSAQRGKYLLITGGVVSLFVIAAIAALQLFDINKFKPNIESASFDATGLEVRIKGEMELSFFPLGISAQDIHVTNKGGEIISLEKIKLGVELVPMLKKQVKATSCELVKPRITIVKDAEGRYNFESADKKSTKLRLQAVASLNELKLSQGVLVYLDKKTGEKTELKEINLAIKDLTVVDAPGETIKNVSFTGNMDCKEVRKKNFKIDNVESSIKADKGVFHLKPFTMDIFGAKGEGDATLDRSESDTLYSINLKISKLDFEKFEQSFGIKKVIGGKGDLVAAMTLKEKGSRRMMNGLDGTFSLRGDNLVIYIMDLDKVLSKYETSQEFNLVDLGAFFIAGPLSTFAVRGYRAGDLYKQTRGGEGVITHFNSHWKIMNGVASATDCALATRHNRVALTGRLDLVSERYENVFVALLDDKGCAKFKQKISGPLRKPRISALSVSESIAGPFSHLYGKAKRFVEGGKCEVIYNGSVRQPPE
jgi:uncharacterized protein involved in outer membrane biogenesis